MVKSYGESLYKLQGYAGKTVNWIPSDSESRFISNMETEKSRNKLERYGWDAESISYIFNSDGFRSEEFQDGVGDSIMFLGCSLTVGVGIDLERTWAYLVAETLGLRRYNLGVGGGGPDMCFRLAHHWIPRLQPKYVVMLTPSSKRFEVITNNSGDMQDYLYLPRSVSHNPDNVNFYDEWLSHPANADMNYLKSVMGVQALCDKRKIPMVEVSGEDFLFKNKALRNDVKTLLSGRDLMHPGVEWHSLVARDILSRIEKIL